MQDFHTGLLTEVGLLHGRQICPRIEILINAKEWGEPGSI